MLANISEDFELKHLKVIAFTHKQLDLKDLGNLVIDDEQLDERLRMLKERFDIPELFYIGTCNRVEFVFYSAHKLTDEFMRTFLSGLSFQMPDDQIESLLAKADKYEGIDALRHLFRMSCSMESLVVGEKEILAQVRRSYERCKRSGFTGDFIRLMMDNLVRTAKEVYTYTHISRKPISVVSLAYRKLKEFKLPENPRIIIIGAGETNQNVSKYLSKHKLSNFTIFNRTLEKAELLANDLGAMAYPLSELPNFKDGFDVLITCTGATNAIIDVPLYTSLINGETDRKVVMDLAIPNDLNTAVLAKFPIQYIEVSSLQAVAEQNIQDRYAEIEHADKIIEENIQAFMPILRQRKVEIAMQEVPQKVKEIKSFALNEVFAREVNALDEESRQVLEKVMSYMEKKYIKVPMVMAKEILVNQHIDD